MRVFKLSGLAMTVLVCCAVILYWRQAMDPSQIVMQPVTCVCFSPDATYLAAGGGITENSGEIRIWATTEWNRSSFQFRDFTSPVETLFFLSDSNLVALSNAKSQTGRGNPNLGAFMHSWDLKNSNREVEKQQLTRRNSMYQAAFHRKNNMLALCANSPPFILTGFRAGSEVELKEHKESSAFLCFSPDGRTILSCAKGHPSLRLYDVGSNKLLKVRDFEMALCACAAFSNDGRLVAVVTKDGDLTVMASDLERVFYSRKVSAMYQYLSQHALSFAPDSKSLAVKHDWHTVEIMNATTGETIEPIELSAGIQIDCLDFSSDGRLLAMGGRDNTKRGRTDCGVVFVWDLGAKKFVAELRE